MSYDWGTFTGDLPPDPGSLRPGISQPREPECVCTDDDDDNLMMMMMMMITTTTTMRPRKKYCLFPVTILLYFFGQNVCFMHVLR